MVVRKIQHDQVRAEAAALSGLIDQLGDEDVMTRFGLEDRLEEIRREMSNWLLQDDEPTASAALFFGGRPVSGKRGVESEFGAAAVSKFQDVISKVMAVRAAGSLGQRGVVPNKGASTLHITNVVRGSFGFLLEEIEPQSQIFDTSLKSAVEDASQLLDAFGEIDEERFRTAVEDIDERVLGTARDFFELMRQNGATLRLVTGDEDHSFGADAVARAADRAQHTTIEDTDERIRGYLTGILPEAHQFEFRALTERGTIRGKVDRSLTSQRLLEFNRDWIEVDADALVKVRRVLRNRAVVRETYTLIGITSPEGDKSGFDDIAMRGDRP